MNIAHPEDAHRCQDYLERLSRYLDGDLGQPDRETIEAHLRDCPCCEDVLDSLRHTVKACHDEHPELPADVRARASARVKELLAKRQGHAAR